MRAQVILGMTAPAAPAGPAFEPVTVHAIGDLHFTTMQSEVYIPERMDTFRTDVLAMPVPDYRIQIGDLTENSGNNQTVMVQNLFAELEAGTGLPVIPIAGNHDYYNDNDDTVFASRHGLDPNWLIDVGDNLRFVGLSPVKLEHPVGIINETWLDSATNTDRMCVVFCHFPLYNTVLQSDDPTSKTSTDEFYHAHSINGINAILANRPNVKAWISGHTHSGLDAVGFLKEHMIGGRRIATVSTSAIAHTPSRPVTEDMPLCSPVIVIHPDRLEITFRDHKTGGIAPVDGHDTTVLRFDRKATP